MRKLGSTRIALAALALPWAAAAAQPQMLCGHSASVDRFWCVRSSDVREDFDGQRSAGLYVGSRWLVMPTAEQAQVDCRGRVLRLVSSNRTVYWSASFDRSEFADQLGGSICDWAPGALR